MSISGTPPSPLKAFVETASLLGKNRKLLASMSADSEWRLLLEDLEMMIREGVIIGLRTRWARRVATPIFQAHRALSGDTGTRTQRAQRANEILLQCEDNELHKTCADWIRKHYV